MNGHRTPPDPAQPGTPRHEAGGHRPSANRHEAFEAPETLLDGLRDAVSARTVMLGVGVLILQLGFILSYIGAFHAPVPHHIPVTVVAPAAVSQTVISQLNALPGQPISATAGTDEVAARQDLSSAATSAVYLVNPTGEADTLLVASAGGTSVSEAVSDVFARIAEQQHRTVSVQDVVVLQSGDGGGLTGFYAVIGWAVGGYLFAAMLGIAKGARPATVPRALWRLGATLPYSLASGLGGALIAGPVLGALTGHVWAIAAVGALVTLAAATVTIAFETQFGDFGVGLTVIVFVILGNPSAGGAYQPALLPPFWRTLSPILPNGTATDAIRRIVYFGGDGITGPIAVLIGWSLAGIVLTMAAATWVSHRQRAATPLQLAQ